MDQKDRDTLQRLEAAVVNLQLAVNTLLARTTPPPPTGRVADSTPAVRPGYELPELRQEGIDPATIDGMTVQADGSVWAYDIPKEQGGRVVRSVYGYFSRAKDPGAYDMIAAIVGEQSLMDTLKFNGPWARYVADMPALVRTGSANFVNLGYALSNPLR